MRTIPLYKFFIRMIRKKSFVSTSFFMLALMPNLCFSQYRKIPDKEMLVRKFKVFNIDYTNKDILNSYLKKFDIQYDSYRTNEFELRNKQAALKKEFSTLINSINYYNEIFYTDLEMKFGEYNFTTNKFEFKPFTEYKDSKHKSHTQIGVLGIGKGIWGGEMIGCGIVIRNLDFVDGLSMDPETAQEFIKKRTINNYGSSIDRVVYGRLYYVIDMGEKVNLEGYYTELPEECLRGIPLKLEIWGDKCRMNDFITQYYVNQKEIPTKFGDLTSVGYDLMKATDSTKKDNLLFYSPDKTSENSFGAINIAYWSQFYKDNCETGYFVMNGEFGKDDAEQKTMIIYIHTNYYYVMQPGYEITFSNANTGVKYPLVVRNLNQYVQNGYPSTLRLEIKITKRTIQEMLNAKINDIQIQISGNPKYQWTGKPVYNWDETIKSKVNVLGAYYNTNSQGYSEMINNFLKRGL